MRLFLMWMENAVCMYALVLVFCLMRRRLLSRMRARGRYAACAVLMLGLLIPLRPAPPSTLFEVDTWRPVQQEALPAQPLPETLPYGDTPPAGESAAAPWAYPGAEPLGPVSSPSARPLEVACLVWLLGAAATALALTVRHARLCRHHARWRRPPEPWEATLYADICRAQGVASPPGLHRCEPVQSPMLVGIVRPRILLPAHDLDAEALALVLRHELTHYTRRDLWLKALSLGTLCAHWFCPLVWHLSGVMGAECEMACDDAVLQGEGGLTRRLYGRAILRTMQPDTPPPLSTCFLARSSDVRRRFLHMLDMRPRKAGRVLLAVLCAGTLMSGSVLAVLPGDVPAGTPMDMEADISPTTGRRYAPERGNAYRPMLVEVSNGEEARPVMNLDLADIVYEYTFWGPGYTRFLALYNDYHPEMVGSIRGTRVSSVDLREQWDCPLVMVGGQDTRDELATSVTARMDALMVPEGMRLDALRAGTNPQSLFSRVQGRLHPHATVANLALALSGAWPADPESGLPHEPKRPGLTFAKGDVRRGARAGEIFIPYSAPAHEICYRYDAAARRYLRYDGHGEAQRDGLTGRQLGATNVLVQYVGTDYAGMEPARPSLYTVGSGRVDAFIGGYHIEGTWQRDGVTNETLYRTSEGEPLLLLPGNTFIQLVPPGCPIVYS